MSEPRNNFERAAKARQLLEVPMNQCKTLMPDDPLKFIGTQDLNGCTAVVILGKAIMLSHIAPLPPASKGADTDPQRKIGPTESPDFFTSMLRSMIAYVELNGDLFPKRTTGWGIYAVINNEDALPEREEIAERLFTAAGLPSKPLFYMTTTAVARRGPASGTVIAGKKGEATALWVEDKPIHLERWDEFVQTSNAAESSSSRVTEVKDDDDDDDEEDPEVKNLADRLRSLGPDEAQVGLQNLQKRRADLYPRVIAYLRRTAPAAQAARQNR